MLEKCSTCKIYKPFINGFLVVEGKQDHAFLSSFLNCEIVEVGGNAIPYGTLEYIKKLSKLYLPIVLVDPDEAGRRIDKRLLESITNAVSICLPKPKGKHHKYGVAESSKEDVLKYLEKHLTSKSVYVLTEVNPSLITFNNKKEEMSIKYSLGTNENKLMIHRLQMLRITNEEIIKFTNGN